MLQTTTKGENYEQKLNYCKTYGERQYGTVVSRQRTMGRSKIQGELLWLVSGILDLEV